MYRLTERGEAYSKFFQEFLEENLLTQGYVPNETKVTIGTLWTIEDTGEIPPSSEYMNKAWELMNKGYIEEI